VNSPHHSARLTLVTALPLVTALLGISVPAISASTPTAADLARCAAIAGPDARLACYDGLAGHPAPPAAVPPAAIPAAAIPAAAIPAASSPRSTAPAVPAPAVPPAPAAAATPAPTFASDPQNFGFTEAQKRAQAQPHAAPEGPTAIQARVTKIVDNPAGRSYVVLDNGETWVFVDAADDARLRPGDQVTIKRGSLGSFLLLTSAKGSYHVHRTQ